MADVTLMMKSISIRGLPEAEYDIHSLRYYHGEINQGGIHFVHARYFGKCAVV